MTTRGSSTLHKATLLLLTTTLLTPALAWKNYQATVTITEEFGANRQNLHSWDIPFRIDKLNLKYGFSTPVFLYKMIIDPQTCKVKHTSFLKEWFAAYVDVPETCSRIKLVHQLMSAGADFIFLEGPGSDPDFRLHSNGLTVPVFIINNALSDFGVAAKAIEDPEEGSYKYYENSMRIHITMPNPPSKGKSADLDFFYHPTSWATYNFTTPLGLVYNDMKEYMNLRVVSTSFSLPFDSDESNCISRGLYCAVDPDGAYGPSKGRDVVYEMIRQKCLYKLHPSDYFFYMSQYALLCVNQFSNACHEKALKKTRVKKETVAQCFEESFKKKDRSGRAHNRYLDKDLEIYAEEQPSHTPSLYINGVIYSGPIEYKYIANAICLTLKEEPLICSQVKERLPYGHEDFLNTVILFSVITLISLLVTAFLCVLYQRWKYSKTMDDEVRRRIDRYYQIKGGETELN